MSKQNKQIRTTEKQGINNTKTKQKQGTKTDKINFSNQLTKP